LLIQGGDTNAGLIEAVTASSVCQNPEPHEEKYGECAGIMERSFLGNAHQGHHSAQPSTEREYDFKGSSNFSTCVGCYIEGTSRKSHMDQNVIVIGQGGGWEGNGTRWKGQKLNRLVVENDRDPDNIVAIELGSASGTDGTFYGLRHYENSWILRSKWVPSSTVTGQRGVYREDLGNLGAGKVRDIEGTKGMTGAGSDLGHTKHFDFECGDPGGC
jgi:hypothetical protein